MSGLFTRHPGGRYRDRQAKLAGGAVSDRAFERMCHHATFASRRCPDGQFHAPVESAERRRFEHDDRHRI